MRGDVLVHLTTERAERLAPGTVLDTDRGVLTVRSSSPHHDRWIVSFEEIADRTAAEAWRGTALRAEALTSEPDEDSFWVHELVGAEVALADGTVVGIVDAVEANPASDLLSLRGGQLVPLAFVTDHSAGRVVIDPPEGLLDL